MLSNCDAQDAQNIPFHTHPHDSSVDKEYENLTRAWKHELIDNVPSTPNNDYMRFAWMRLMDHYLDQHWLDSKQMLQCAQAWSARDEISVTEAVHTMNVLSLKSMQRSLDARQELLQALTDPDIMGFGISQQSSYNKRFSSMSSLTAGSEVEDDDVHAPLFIKHNNTPIEEEDTQLSDEAIITTMDSKREEITDSEESQDTMIEPSSLEDVPLEEELEVGEEVKSRKTYDEEEEDEDHATYEEIYKRNHSISSSISSPNISSSLSHHGGLSRRKYESYYQKLHEKSSWKEMDVNDDLLLSEDDCDSIHSHDSDISSPLGSGIQWKSWFVGSDNSQSTSDFANEKVETDASFSNFHPEYKKQSYLMVRSESSISAFRPISNNLAPRCLVSQSSEFLVPTPPVITKSKSFPSKIALNEATPPPPVPNQKSNFMIRSIVSKKVSLSKLFGSKKSSSSSQL